MLELAISIELLLYGSKDARQRNYITLLCREIKHPVRKISKKYQPRSLTLWTPMKGTILVPLHNQHRIYVEEEVSFLSLPWSCPLFFCTYSVVFMSSVTKGDRYLQPELRLVNLLSMTWTMKMRTGLRTLIMSGRI